MTILPKIIEPNYIESGDTENIQQGMAIGDTPRANTPALKESESNIVPSPDGSSIVKGSLKASNNNWEIAGSGVATFKNIKIGGTTLQYQITNAGILNFGDGSDGDLTTSGDVTLTADKYYDSLIITAGDTLNPAGYRIFCKTSLTINGTIARNGNNGGNGTAGGNGGGAGGTGGGEGTALADGYLKGAGSSAGGAGGNPGSPPTVGGDSTGANTSNSIGSNGADGGNGGKGGDEGGGGSAGGTGGTSTNGTATASNVKLIANWHLATLLDVATTGASVKFDNSAEPAGGGGGGGGGGVNGGGGGGGGGSASGGGIVAIYAKSIVIATTGVISANGGNGGNGANGGNGGAGNVGGGGGGGAGAGGNGGQIILVYNSLTNNGTIQATLGTKGTIGTGGTGSGTGQAGVDGSVANDGTAGTIRQFQVSL